MSLIMNYRTPQHWSSSQRARSSDYYYFWTERHLSVITQPKRKLTTPETLRSASPTSREVVVTDLPEATTTSHSLLPMPLVDDTKEQLGINIHTAFARQHERRRNLSYWPVFFFRTALPAKCNKTLAEEGIRGKMSSSHEISFTAGASANIALQWLVLCFWLDHVP